MLRIAPPVSAYRRCGICAEEIEPDAICYTDERGDIAVCENCYDNRCHPQTGEENTSCT